MVVSVTPWVWLFVGAFGLGLVFNLTPGAVFAETLRRGLHEGYHAALVGTSLLMAEHGVEKELAAFERTLAK